MKKVEGKTVQTNSMMGYDLTGSDISSMSLDTNYWYFPPVKEFNNGFPYLESFIKFNYWRFTPLIGGKMKATSEYINAEVSNTEEIVIEIPSTIDISNSVISENCNFYGVNMQVIADDTYYFTGWTASADGKTFTANFKREKYKISYVEVIYDGIQLYYQDLTNTYIAFNDILSIPVSNVNSGDIKMTINITNNTTNVIEVGDGAKYYISYIMVENKENFNYRQDAQGPWMRFKKDLGDNEEECGLVIELELKYYGVAVS